MSEQDTRASQTAPDGYRTWTEYWTKEHNQPWRREREISKERQDYLAELRALSPEVDRGVYPFRGVVLRRADIEWLLATHDGGRGPVNWDDGAQRQREGLDLRGCNLPNIDLSGLPLARLHAGLDGGDEYDKATPRQREWAALHIPGGKLDYARLEGARLSHAHLEGISARNARFAGAEMYEVHLDGNTPADLSFCSFDETTRLDYAAVGNRKGVGPRLRGVQWGGADLSFVDWFSVRLLDDERMARQWRNAPHTANDTRLKQYRRAVQANSMLANALRAQGSTQRANRFAYRARLCKRAALWREGVSSWGIAVGSWLLDVISGYGYKPMRSVCTYIVIILSFAVAYFAVTNFTVAPFPASHSTPLPWYEALVLSVASFHGRGFFPTGLSLGDPIAILAAFEAVIGLLIEIIFIATFTQRFFAR